MSNQYKKELLNALKKYNLISLVKTQIAKHKFKMECTFDGTIVPGSIMTINQLAEIVTKGFTKVELQFEEQKKFNEEQKKFNELVLERFEEQKKFNEEQKKFNGLVLERFEEQKKFNGLVLERLDKIEIKLDEHTRILDEHTRILDKHEDIFKRNNLQ